MRPNIETPKYQMEKLEDILIEMVIMSAKEIIKDKSQLKAVCNLLERYNWDTFTRIMLYLLMNSGNIDLIKEKLLNKKYFFKQGLYREYYQLLKKYFSKLDQVSKDQILDMIDKDEEYTGNREYYDLAINTTRGKALECLIKYALWIREDVKRNQSEEYVTNNGFNSCDRLKAVKIKIEDVLKNEKTNTVLSILGFYLPWLVLLDKNWCEENKKLIFPRENDLKEKLAAIWHTYIKYSQPYNIVFEIFEDEYKYWTDNWKYLDDKENKYDNAFGLLQHLIQFYWRKKQNDKEEYWFDLKGKNGEYCFEYVFGKMPKPAIAKLFRFIGRMLRSEKKTSLIQPKNV